MRLRTFGGLALEHSDFTRPKPLLLATYLAVEGPQHRRFLAELFWPDARDRMKSLTVALARLRKGAPGAVDADGERAWAYLGCDAAEFLSLLEKGASNEALELYRGPFLDGLYLRTWGAELEEWVFRTREFFAGHALQALLAAAEQEAARARFDEAAARAEQAHRLSGTAALEPETLARLHTLLLAGRSPHALAVRDELSAFELSPAATSEAARERLRETVGLTVPPVPHNLAVQTTAFVGRDLELTELATLLAQPDGRLVTITGTAGVGKTGLALQAAREQLKLGAFAGGVYAVSLGPLTSEALIPSAIAKALELDLQADREPLAQVSAHIDRREMLLVLDDFEHLIEGVATLPELIEACPNLTLLVTSRERLHVRGERVFRIAGLPHPAGDRPPLEDAARFDAIRLFVQRAKRARHDFTLSEETLPGVIEACRLVEGLPLGIELAATWVHVMPVADIVEELAEDPDALTMRTRNVPERHRSLRSALEHSWGLLAPRERDAMRRLSVFRGGFRRRAAGEVAGATIPILASLADKSLLRADATGRYDRHPLVYRYTQEKLAQDADEQARTRARHGAFYLRRLQAWGDPNEFTREEALRALEEELANVRIAWDWAIAHGQLAGLAAGIGLLYAFFYGRGRLREGVEFFARALDGRIGDIDGHETVVANLLLKQGTLFYRLGDYDRAADVIQRAMEIARAHGMSSELASGRNTLGSIAWRTGEYDQAREHWRRALTLARRDRSRDAVAGLLGNLGLLEQSVGNYREAKQHLEEALAIKREQQDEPNVIRLLNNLGRLSLFTQDLQAALAYSEKGLELARGSGIATSIPYALVNLGQAAYELGDHARAEGLFREALEAAQGNNLLEAGALAMLGRIATATKRIHEAERCFARALDIALTMRARPAVLEFLVGLADLRSETGDLERALDLLGLVLHDPATERFAKDRARSSLDRLAGRVPPETIEAALERGKTMDMDTEATIESRRPILADRGQGGSA